MDLIHAFPCTPMIKRFFQRIGRSLLLRVLEATVILIMLIVQLIRMILGFIRTPRLPGFSWKIFWESKKGVILAGSGLLILAGSLVLLQPIDLSGDPEKQAWFASELRIPAESMKYIPDDSLFKATLVDMGRRLHMNPSWILAVMFHESRLNPAARNFRGSGATGLIQFMGPALKDLNKRLQTGYYLSDIRRMDALAQLTLVEAYYEMVQERYGQINNFPDAYLAVLFPKAIGKSPEYILFSKPGRRYAQNAGLDLNQDGHITVSDISGRLFAMFPDLAETSQSSLVSGK